MTFHELMLRPPTLTPRYLQILTFEFPIALKQAAWKLKKAVHAG